MSEILKKELHDAKGNVIYPKTTSDQIDGLNEKLDTYATKEALAKAELGGHIDDYLTKTEALGTYVSEETADEKYLTKTEAFTKETADSLYADRAEFSNAVNSLYDAITSARTSYIVDDSYHEGHYDGTLPENIIIVNDMLHSNENEVTVIDGGITGDDSTYERMAIVSSDGASYTYLKNILAGTVLIVNCTHGDEVPDRWWNPMHREFIKFGDTKLSLSNYITKEDLKEKLNGYVTNTTYKMYTSIMDARLNDYVTLKYLKDNYMDIIGLGIKLASMESIHNSDIAKLKSRIVNSGSLLPTQVELPVEELPEDNIDNNVTVPITYDTEYSTWNSNSSYIEELGRIGFSSYMFITPMNTTLLEEPKCRENRLKNAKRLYVASLVVGSDGKPDISFNDTIYIPLTYDIYVRKSSSNNTYVITKTRDVYTTGLDFNATGTEEWLYVHVYDTKISKTQIYRHIANISDNNATGFGLLQCAVFSKVVGNK